MIDYLLAVEENDPCKDEMSEMIYSRDINGKNVLATYFKTDLDLGTHFLDQHISTNGENENAEKFMIRGCTFIMSSDFGSTGYGKFTCGISL